MAGPIPLSFTPILMPVVFLDIGTIPLKSFYQTIVVDVDTCIDWLQQNGLLARGMICKCGIGMRPGKFTLVTEGRGWRCPEKNCRKVASLRVGSFFESSNLPLIELVEFLYLWAKDIQSTHILEENLGWSTATITDWKNFLRDLCVEIFN